MTADTIELHGFAEGCVVFTDRQGGALLPVEDIPRLVTRAKNHDDGVAQYQGRLYDRDNLIAIQRALDERDRCANCHDAPATEPMGDGVEFCVACRAASAGSRYDDRERAL